MTGFKSKREAALAQPAQEPFGWYSAQEDEFMTDKIRKEHERLNSYTHIHGKFDLALYTTPPQRPWVDENAIRADERERIKAANAPEIERINVHLKSLEDAVLEEREACALMADDAMFVELGDAIRARGNT